MGWMCSSGFMVGRILLPGQLGGFKIRATRTCNEREFMSLTTEVHSAPLVFGVAGPGLGRHAAMGCDPRGMADGPGVACDAGSMDRLALEQKVFPP
jgi:hypothetical protein